MKKFGTPIGAGPGSESENVGFEVLGTPLPDGSFAFCEVVVLFFFFGLLLGLLLGLRLAPVDGPWPWLEDFSGDDEVGFGVVLDESVVLVLVVPGLECEGEVEVELEVVDDEDDELAEDDVEDVEDDEDDEDDEDEDEDEELDELGGAIVVVVVVVVVVVDDDEVAGEQVIVIVSVAPGIPRSGMAGMTPGVASTGSVFTTTPPTVTVTVHGSAEAIGMAARARTTEIEAASSSTARSLRLNVKLVRPLLPPSRCASHASIRCTSAVPRARY